MVVERKADSVRKNRSGLFVKSRLISQSNLWPPRWPPSGSLVSLSALFLPKSYDSAISIRTPKCNNWTLLFLHYLFLHRSQHLWEFYLLDLLLSPWFRFVFLLIIIMINIISMVSSKSSWQPFSASLPRSVGGQATSQLEGGDCPRQWYEATHRGSL